MGILLSPVRLENRHLHGVSPHALEAGLAHVCHNVRHSGRFGSCYAGHVWQAVIRSNTVLRGARI